MSYRVDIQQVSVLFAISFAFLWLRFIVKWLMGKFLHLLSQQDRISTIISSFSTNFTGIEFLIFCIFIDSIYLVNWKSIVTPDYLIWACPLEAIQILCIFLLIHFSMVLTFVGITVATVIKPELEKKSLLVFALVSAEVLGMPPIANLSTIANKTTRKKTRHLLDFIGFTILLITLVLLFGKAR